MSALANNSAVVDGSADTVADTNVSSDSKESAITEPRKAVIPGSKDDMQQKTSDFFNSVLELAKEETSQTSQELGVLEQMNNLATSEYAQIEDTVKSLSSFQKDVKKKQDLLASYIGEIEKLDKTTLELEHVVGILDEYTKRIEAKAKPFM